MAKCVVTGAAGFIGSRLVGELLTKDHEVVGIDNFLQKWPSSTGVPPALSDATGNGQFEFFDMNIRDPRLRLAVADSDLIFHLAGRPGVTASWHPPFDDCALDNVAGTQCVLDAAAHGGIPRVVLASSSSVYRGVENGTTEVAPRSPYGISKLASERLAQLYAERFGITAVALRYFTVFGPGQRNDMAFHRLINAALLDSVFTLDGDGQQQRDFTYVGDVVDATISAGFAPSPGSTYDIGQGRPHTLNSVIEFVSEYLRVQIDIERNPEGDSGAEITRASTDAAASDLGWTASTTLEFGLIRQIAHQEAELQALSLA